MLTVGAELDLMNWLLMLFQPVEQFAGRGVPQADVMADLPENSLPIVVPTPTRPFDALLPLHRFVGHRLAGGIAAYYEEADDDKAECQRLPLPSFA